MLSKNRLISLQISRVITTPILFILSITCIADPHIENPSQISHTDANKILEKNVNWFDVQGAFNSGGIGIHFNRIEYDRIVLDIKIDRQLNLWRGRPNDLASAHGGKLEIIIHSIINQSGNNIYRLDAEKPWHKRVTIYQSKQNIFHGTRLAYIPNDIQKDQIQQINGTAKLHIPVDWNYYTINVDLDTPFKNILQHRLISDISYQDNRLKLSHPNPIVDTAITVLGYSKTGKRLAVFGTGTAGTQPDNHWFQFSKQNPIETIHLWISTKRIHKELKFTVSG